MIARAIERGVSSADIADALGLQSPSFAGSVCGRHQPEVAEMLKDTPCSMKVFDVLR
ncbi:plasmid partitioning protein RepB C-terminal domain-containing protein, partial [Sinorhizobium meliloti]